MPMNDQMAMMSPAAITPSEPNQSHMLSPASQLLALQPPVLPAPKYPNRPKIQRMASITTTTSNSTLARIWIPSRLGMTARMVIPIIQGSRLSSMMLRSSETNRARSPKAPALVSKAPTNANIA